MSKSFTIAYKGQYLYSDEGGLFLSDTPTIFRTEQVAKNVREDIIENESIDNGLVQTEDGDLKPEDIKVVPIEVKRL